jgi:hypothetical protein
MALDDATVESTLDYLGGRQPGLSQRIATLPSTSAGGGAVAPPVTGGGGTAGEGGATAMGLSPGAPGASPLAMANAALKGGRTLLDLAGRVVSPLDLGTRGDTGGVSLSDQVRSLEAAGQPVPVAGGGALTGAEASLATEAEQGAAGAGVAGAEAGVEAGTVAAESALGLISSAIGAVTWPFTVGPLIASLFGTDMSVMDMFGTGSGDRPTDYMKFPGTLAFNESQQGRGLSTLAQALPYVQSKEELGQLLNMYRQYVGGTQGAPLNPASGVYNLTTIPGASGREHGVQGQAVDWGPDTAFLQSVIDRYQGVLPGQDITDFNAQPKGPDEMRLWQQFLDREGTAPKYSPGLDPRVIPGTEGSSQEVPGIPKGPYYGADQGTEGLISYGQPGYDYAATGWPEPGQFLGNVNPLFASLFGAAPAAPEGTPGSVLPVGVSGQAMPLTPMGPQGALGFAQDVVTA